MTRAVLAAATVAFFAAAGSAPAVVATPYLRVEGRSMTLFEGPLRADGGLVRGTTDAVDRRCDGTNAGASTAPGPTPTSLAAHGLALTGETFTGQWLGGFEDYFITRFGPDSAGDGVEWGVLVDGAITDAGGCQVKAPTGSEVLWAYDAFSDRPFLRLDPPGPVRAPGQLGFAPAGTVIVAPGASLPLRVRRHSGAPEQSVGATAGVTIARVTTAPNGFQHLGETVATTDAEGLADVRLPSPGWHRLKATADGFIRSNRLDVCVPAAGATDCGPAPADAQVRDVVPVPSGTPVPTATVIPGAPPAPAATATDTSDPPARLAKTNVSVEGTRVHVRFSGAAPAHWSIHATPLGAPGARPRIARTTAFALPAGREYALEFVAAGHRADLGRVLIPLEHRASAIRYRGRTARRGAYTRLHRGAAASARLAAGRPTLLLTPRSSATVEIAGRRYVVNRGRTRLRAVARVRAGTVKVVVRSGTLELRGIAAGE